MNIEIIKIIHISCVVLSFSGFFVRGILMLTDSVLMQKKWVKISPHIIDTLLLVSALLLLYAEHLNVFENNWLMTKIIALLIYIGLGTFALKRGKSKKTRLMFWFAGLSVFLYIVSVALTKSASGFIGFIF